MSTLSATRNSSVLIAPSRSGQLPPLAQRFPGGIAIDHPEIADPLTPSCRTIIDGPAQTPSLEA